MEAGRPARRSWQQSRKEEGGGLDHGGSYNNREKGTKFRFILEI